MHPALRLPRLVCRQCHRPARAPASWSRRAVSTSSTTSTLRSSRPWLGLALGTSLIAAALDDRTDDLLLAVEGLMRTTVTISLTASIILDWKLLHTRWRFKGYDSDEYATARDEANARTARKILWLCRFATGLYLKAGQFIGSLGPGAVPKIYIESLSVLQDRAPVRSIASVRRTFRSEFNGARPEDLFDDFCEQPVASASLAQVHLARDRETGERLAVKVQHDDVSRLFTVDMMTMRLLAKICRLMFRESINLNWLVNEFERQASLEFDFLREGENCQETGRRFAEIQDLRAGEITTPKVYWRYSTRRILTMQCIEGVKVNDKAAILALGIDPKWVYEAVLDSFSRMILQWGTVHGDPHPGNLMVRRLADGRPSLVILDHGLYRKLSDELRLAYCSLWTSILHDDAKEFHDAATLLGCPERFVDFFPLFFTGRLIGGTTLMGGSRSREDQERIKESMKGITTAEIVAFIEQLPRDFLLLSRTNNLVRSIRNQLGGNQLDTLIACARHATYGSWILTHNPTSDPDDLDLRREDGFKTPAERDLRGVKRSVLFLQDIFRTEFLLFVVRWVLRSAAVWGEVRARLQRWNLVALRDEPNLLESFEEA